jgi:hypothetical protein
MTVHRVVGPRPRVPSAQNPHASSTNSTEIPRGRRKREFSWIFNGLASPELLNSPLLSPSEAGAGFRLRAVEGILGRI